MFLRSVISLLGVLLSVHGMAQTVGHELIDMASFFNGGFPYSMKSLDRIPDQLRTISHGRTLNPFSRDDGRQEVNFDANLFYSFATSATIEAFRVTGSGRRNYTPHKIEFALSQSPGGPFQTVAVFDVPASYIEASSTNYDFSIPVKQKASGRYVRITLFSPKKNLVLYQLSSFSAYGRFDQPAKLREDFSGIYSMVRGRNGGSPANDDMVSQQKGTGAFSRLILHQKDGQINGCYVYGSLAKGGNFEEIREVLGTLTGGVENNVFRFTRTYKDGSQSQGAMVLPPVAEGIKNRESGYLLVMNNAKTNDMEGSDAFRVNVTRIYDYNASASCAVTGQKEKTASEAMKETIEKTGKVQLYGVNFDFDSDTLRPESGTVLDEVVTLAKANPAWKFEIGGHTDSVGSADYNLKLSDRRAASVVRYLTGKGIDAARLQAKGYGATRPLVPETGGNDSARAQNRRVELVKQ